MRYYDLPKNKFDEFNNNSKVFCAVWNIIPDAKPNLHWHDYYTIDIISEGEAINYSPVGKEEVSKGFMDLTMPSDIHHIGTITHCRIYTVRFTADAMPNGFDKLLKAVEKSAILSEKELNIVVGFAEAMMLFKDNEKLCQNMLDGLLTVLETRISSEQQPLSDNFKRVMDYIDVNFREAPTLEEVAKVGSYNSSYFSHLFRRTTGYTFLQYLNNKKINYACALMKNKKLSITDIAISSGYTSFSSFNHAFKAVMGVTPSEYRKNIIE